MSPVRFVGLLVLSLATGCSDDSPLRPSPPSAESGAELAQESNGRPEPAGLPYYARLERDFEPIHTEEWAAIVFYREPACVRPDFNLLDFLDIPAAFSCQLTVDGFQIFKDPLPAPPIQLNVAGLGAVPIWFVRWPDLQAAMADDEVTIGELQGLSPVTGSADVFRERLDPFNQLTITARGKLADGRGFALEFTYAGGDVRHLRIAFQ
ncbi:MAG TPA: hypothetical protein VD833_21055 [Vicinamibacterales bacterium]|nr:hypothetical protein [Vicinamibacterales bacterium]